MVLEQIWQVLITTYLVALLLVSLAFFLPILLLVNLGLHFLWLFKHGRMEESH
jgi:hypothetical protein